MIDENALAVASGPRQLVHGASARIALQLRWALWLHQIKEQTTGNNGL